MTSWPKTPSSRERTGHYGPLPVEGNTALVALGFPATAITYNLRASSKAVLRGAKGKRIRVCARSSSL
jgi:hypothetical protein